MRSQAKLKTQLNVIIESSCNPLKVAVAREALDHEEIASFFSDLLRHGCQSGLVGSLIYYCDTSQFYDTYYHEIEAIRYDLEESLGETLKPQGDLKNWFAWLGFEETARQLADELMIDW